MLPLVAFYCIQTQAAPVPLDITKALHVRNITELRFSPDKRRLAIVVSELVPGKRRHSNIWVYDLQARELRQFTATDASDRSPRFSPDSRRLAFLSSRNKGSTIYIMPVDGGEPLPLKEAGDQVGFFDWSPDGKQIAYIAPPKKNKEDEENGITVVDEEKDITGLYLIDLASKKPAAITSANRAVESFDWPSGSKRILIASTETPTAPVYTTKLSLIDPSTKEETPLPVRAPFDYTCLSPDGKTLAYTAPRESMGPDNHDLFTLTIGESQGHNMSKEIDQSFGDCHWTVDGTLVAVCPRGVNTSLVRFDRSKPALIPWQGMGGALDIRDRDHYAYVSTTSDSPPEVMLNEGNRLECITHFNDELKAAGLVKPMICHYKSFDGKEIEALLYLPKTANGAKPPLVVDPHGGPTGQWFDAYEPLEQILVSRGYAVFAPNVRGSTGYGWEFECLNKLDWGGGDYKDLMAGVDYVVQNGYADPDRMGIYGWSYGGYMAAWAITQTQRFKASVVGAPMTDIASEFGTESLDTNRYDQWFNGSLYDKMEEVAKQSPMTYVKNVKTPTLLLQGEQDDIDPIGQSQQFYRALRILGVDVTMVTYAGERHGFQQEKNQIDRCNRIVEFLDKHLKR